MLSKVELNRHHKISREFARPKGFCDQNSTFPRPTSFHKLLTKLSFFLYLISSQHIQQHVDVNEDAAFCGGVETQRGLSSSHQRAPFPNPASIRTHPSRGEHVLTGRDTASPVVTHVIVELTLRASFCPIPPQPTPVALPTPIASKSISITGTPGCWIIHTEPLPQQHTNTASSIFGPALFAFCLCMQDQCSALRDLTPNGLIIPR